MGEYLFKKIRILKTAGIVFPESRKMWNLIHHFKTEEPAVSYIYFDLFYCLAHASYAIEVLDEWKFDQHNGIILGRPLSGLYVSITRS